MVKNPNIMGGPLKSLVRHIFDKKYPEGYDWCRFRRNDHCWYPKGMDEEGTKQAGYPVFTPVERGICTRQTWDEQQKCPVGRPGPHAPGPHFSDGTRSWEEGGQRPGHMIG